MTYSKLPKNKIVNRKGKGRILIISEFFPPYTQGGGEISTYLIAKEISKYNKIYVLTGNFCDKFWELDGIKIFPKLKKTSRDNKTEGVFSFGLKILPFTQINSNLVKKYIKKYNIDLVYLIPSNMYTIPLINTSIKVGKAVCIDVRSLSLLYLAKSTSNKFIGKIIDLFQLYLFNIYTKRLKKLIIKNKGINLVTMSDFIKNKLIEFNYPKDKIIIIPNISEQIQGKLYFKNREKKIIFAGRIEKEKGIWDAVKAFELVNDKNLIFEIVGDGSELEKIKNYIKQKNVKNIKLLGDRKSTRLNSSHTDISRMPSSA